MEFNPKQPLFAGKYNYIKEQAEINSAVNELGKGISLLIPAKYIYNGIILQRNPITEGALIPKLLFKSKEERLELAKERISKAKKILDEVVG